MRKTRWRGLVLVLGTFCAATVSAGIEDKLDRALEYRQVGPYRGGRSTAVSGVRGEPFTFYMGTSGGGVWKTTNAGTSWFNISDADFGAASIGAVVVAPSDPNVVYVGTGSGCPRGNVMNGDGVYRSTDAGSTWQHVGLAAAGLIPRMVVDPRDADVVYAAVLGDIFEPSPERGVYRSRDGGASWEAVLQVSERTGAVDLVIDPANPRVLYAAMWTAERKPWTLVDGSDEGGVWKSIDGGDTWSRLEGGLPGGTLGRIGLALSPARPQRIWAQVTTPDDSGGLFRSDDAGKSWKRVNAERKIQVRAWYYAHLEADPVDPDTVYSLGLRFWRSVDGGASFERISTPHGDNHAMWINPDDPRILIEANDGGAAVSLDHGASWSSLYNQPTAEIYRLTVDDGFPYRLYGAQQDNTSISVPAWSAGGLSPKQEWWRAGGGESGDIALHPERPDVVYSGNYIGLIERWDRRTDERRSIMVYPELADGVPPRDLTYRFQWNAPIRVSPHDPDTLYQASHRLHRSRDGGQTWETISDDLTHDDETKQELPGGPVQHDDTGVEVYGTIFAFEESPHERGLLWAGSDDGRLHLSRDDGATWQEITPPGLAVDSTINMIELSTHDAGRAFLAIHRYRSGDDRPYLLRTDDYGATWTSLASGLPADEPVRVVREDPAVRGLLYAGTEKGVRISWDDGASWQPLDLNLPRVQVSDLAVRHGDLQLATHGRSFWVLDQIAPLRQMTEAIAEADLHLFSLPPAPRVRAAGRFGEDPQPDARGTGARIDFWIGEAALEDLPEDETVGRLTIRDRDGEVVRSYDLALDAEVESEDELEVEVVAAGLNRLVWDFESAEPELLDDAVMSLGYTGGLPMPPDRYGVEVSIGESSVLGFLEVAPDPRLSHAAGDYEAGYQLARAARDRMVEVHTVLERLRSVREQLESIESRLEEAGRETSIGEDAAALYEAFGLLEDELIQKRNEAPQDPLNFPPRLDNQYSFLYGELAFASGRPNSGAYQRMEDLDREWEPLKRRWQELLDNDLAAILSQLEAEELPAILVPE